MKIFIFVLLFLWPLSASAQNTSPVLIELFTSQGCPACPPADAFVKDLDQTRDIIALSCHVDYFKVPNDTMGQFFCTKRQNVYMHQMGSDKMYTPQMVINGHIDAIGYEREDVAGKVTLARAEKVDRIAILPKAAGVYTFALAPKNLSAQADLWLAIYDRPQTVSRRGSSNTYYNVVHTIMPLGEWGGSALHRAVFPITNNKSAGFAIVAQDKQTGKVLAAGNYRL